MLTRPEIQAIVERDNLVIRNLQVTQGYYRLSQGMRKFMGDKNVSWCAFATHASKTAGQALRHELMPRSLKSAMMRAAGYENTYYYLEDVLGDFGKSMDEESNNLLAEAMKRVSLLISAGNVLGFDELAWPFVSLIKTFSRDWFYDQEKLDAFLALYFRPGPLEEDGQDYLKEAFTAYYDARFATEAKKKAEHVLHGNLLVGLHEQTRLQPFIEQALAVPLDVFLDKRKSGQGEAAEVSGEAKGLGQRLKKQTAGITREMVTRAVTRMLMSITLPSRELKLGQDVIAPTGVISFPQDLYPVEDPYLQSWVKRFDAGLDTLSGSAADNWASLADRMSFVVDFFRSHQQYQRLFEQPFLDSQVPAIMDGHLPAGPL